MSEDVVYAIPDLTTKVRYGRRERQQEIEERGEREERIVDIYDSVDNNPGPGTQQDTTQDQHGASDESKKNSGFRAATVCLGLLCVIQMAVITGLVIYRKIKDCDESHSRFTNLTNQKDNMTEERDALKKRLSCESQPEFTFSDGVCYYISTETTQPRTWNESRQFCTDKQSDLMTIKSQKKQNFLESIVHCVNIQPHCDTVWLGLTDMAEEGRFKWVDGTRLPPTFWSKDNPNNNNGYGIEENCVVFVDAKRIWDDRACSNRYRWICERVL